MSDPKLSDVTAGQELRTRHSHTHGAPAQRDCRRNAGDRWHRVGNGERAGEGAVPPPGAGFVTSTFLAPVAAAGVTVIAAVSCVGFTMVTDVTSTFGPNDTEVVPAKNPVPVTLIVRLWPLNPVAGEIAVTVGTGLPTR